MMNRLLHAAAALFVITWLSVAAWYGYTAVVSHPIERVAFAGSTVRIAPLDLEALSRGIQSAAARPSLAEIRDAARRIRWVRDASVRRVSADTIEIRFETHEPLARWNDEGLVSRLGEVFNAEYDEPLPIFRGSDGAAAALTREYPLIVAAVAPLGSPLTELRLNPRGAWQATLASGLVLDLGRHDMEGRIARFASAWPELEGKGIATTHADLRYPNGFALRTTEKPKDRDKEKKRAT